MLVIGEYKCSLAEHFLRIDIESRQGYTAEQREEDKRNLAAVWANANDLARRVSDGNTTYYGACQAALALPHLQNTQLWHDLEECVGGIPVEGSVVEQAVRLRNPTAGGIFGGIVFLSGSALIERYLSAKSPGRREFLRTLAGFTLLGGLCGAVGGNHYENKRERAYRDARQLAQYLDEQYQALGIVHGNANS